MTKNRFSTTQWISKIHRFKIGRLSNKNGKGRGKIQKKFANI